MVLGRPPILKDVIEEHLEELDFLWEQRESVVFAPDWTLADLAELEERAEAHLDGLRLAEQHGVDLALEALASGETGAATAATFVLMESGVPSLAADLVAAFEAGDAATVEGVRIGLRHGPVEPVAEALERLAVSDEGAVRASAFDVLAFHRRPVPAGLEDLLNDEDPALRRLAWGAAGRVPGTLGEPHLDRAFEEPAPDLRRIAFEAGARSGIRSLRERCLQAPQDPVALEFLGVLGHPGDLDGLVAALADPALVEAALRGLGALGLPASIPAIITAMEEPKTAAAAGAAFIRITGFEDVVSPPAPGTPPAADLDEPDADDEPDAAPPDPERARLYWDTAVHRFHPQTPWQSGLSAQVAIGSAEFDAHTLESRRDLVLRRAAVDAPAAQPLDVEWRAGLQVAASSNR